MSLINATWPTRFARNEDGAVAVVVGLLMTVLMGFVAFGVDIGALYRERAQLQATSDLTAISVMTDTAAAQIRADTALGRNGRATDTLQDLQTGRFRRNPAIAPADRFMPLPTGHPRINAVAVTLSDAAPLYFAQIFTDATQVPVTGRATATRTGAASFSLTSHIARLDALDLNTAIARRFGTDPNLTPADIDSLASARLRVGDLVVGIDTGTNANPAAILDGTTTDDRALAALRELVPDPAAAALDPVANAARAQGFAMTDLISGADTDLGLTVIEFLDGLDASALDLLRGLVATGGAATTLDLATDLAVPGVTSVTADIASGAPPAQSGWIAIGEADTTLNRAAARLNADVTLAPDVLGPLDIGVTATQINLPLRVELAGSTATLDRISCTGSDPDDVVARFRTSHTPLHPGNGTSVAALYLGTLPAGVPVDPATLDFADLLDLTIRIELPLLPDLVVSGITLQARSTATVGQSAIDTIAFTRADVAAGRTRAGFGSGQLTSTAIADLLSPGNLELRVKPEDAGLVDTLVAPVLDTVMAALPGQILAGLTGPLDAVVDGVLAPTGLQLGEGELTLTGHHCELIRLVQ
ncbi:pilus assembly protein TadG-related protein [Loktanella sp. SALINAS62]|uniref:pilus assembly protein TadG-related protein n=1 Tax=Loktanella sp. SALINAS62 TaxID=2706124 RepID=UPI001B8B9A8E|nr:pilus assembly protein TadG-related protein [Loktanella sp. SALINAS62]MBS1301765.1 hypothetical protein [Loktanella sp. SALINAS62]